MKKLFGIICLSLIITLSVSNPSCAQVDYSFAVVWIDSNCDGGSILEKELYWEVYYLGETPPELIGSGTEDVTSNSPNYEDIDNNGEVFEDCPNCYKIYAKVRYRDSSGWFCVGDGYIICDGDDLRNGDQTVYVTMN